MRLAYNDPTACLSLAVMLPFNTQNLFTAKSEQTIRRTQMFMPLYMMMFPFLVVVAYDQLGTHEHVHSANGAFMAAALQLLPRWVLGIVVAGAALQHRRGRPGG